MAEEGFGTLDFVIMAGSLIMFGAIGLYYIYQEALKDDDKDDNEDDKKKKDEENNDSRTFFVEAHPPAPIFTNALSIFAT